MHTVLACISLIATGLFTGIAAAVSLGCAPIWGSQDTLVFRNSFTSIVPRVDRVQPLLEILAALTSACYAVTVDSAPRILAFATAAIMLAIAVGSLAFLVPVQTDIMSCTESDLLGAWRARWLPGHHLRSTIAVIAFACISTAVALQ
ncbi:DUF1772 domain-containing protein [Nocardia sp. NBC_00508]|uniref:hypothetical protein n=1 Tax=Nocardia sp. NBC_00508 TaxID=2975992 RepID=UPI002E81F16D|nr:hypothetical protein [Nocardia sp. NBC_00508]WUD66706.1 DUF1772 domain-containing protein [Nocardia sp. NBC_00508]